MESSWLYAAAMAMLVVSAHGSLEFSSASDLAASAPHGAYPPVSSPAYPPPRNLQPAYPPVMIMPPAEATPCVCLAVYLPVCGTDGNTYGNNCQAECAGVGVAYNGRCGLPPLHISKEALIGGSKGAAEASDSGNSSQNEPSDYVLAATDNTTTACGQADGRPVCGADGQSYWSACLAQAAGTQVVQIGVCPRDCQCYRRYDPVCSTANQTLINSCVAECLDADIAYVGKCDIRTDTFVGPGGYCACSKEYVPVCGSEDQQPYANSCLAKCAGQTNWSVGDCPTNVTLPSDCGCPAVISPVCGADNLTYSSACAAACAGQSIIGWSVCADAVRDVSTSCPLTYQPVCGVDNQTYSNNCSAVTAGVLVDYPGVCRANSSCGCPITYAPVCGADGATYSNNCTATCLNVTISYTGECGSNVTAATPAASSASNSTTVSQLLKEAQAVAATATSWLLDKATAALTDLSSEEETSTLGRRLLQPRLAA